MSPKPVIISSSEPWSPVPRGNLGVAAAQAANSLTAEYGVFTKTRQQAMEHQRPEWLEPLRADLPLEEGRDTNELVDFVEDVCSQSCGIIPKEKQWIKNDASRIAEEARARAKAGRRSSVAGPSTTPQSVVGQVISTDQQAPSTTAAPARSASPLPDVSLLEGQEWHQELRHTPQPTASPAPRRTSRREQGTAQGAASSDARSTSPVPGVVPGVRASLLSMRGMGDLNKLGVGPPGEAPPTNSQPGRHSSDTPLPAVLADKLRSLGLTSEAFSGLMSRLGQASTALPPSMRHNTLPSQAPAATSSPAEVCGLTAQVPADVAPAAVHAGNAYCSSTSNEAVQVPALEHLEPSQGRQMKERTNTSRWNI